MTRISVSAERAVAGPAEMVYRYIADMREHHRRFLPPAFSDFQVESGGVDAGTVTPVKMTAGGRTREYQIQDAEPQPGRSSLSPIPAQAWSPRSRSPPRGGASRVQISSTWDGAGGIGGLFERMFAPGWYVASSWMSSVGATHICANMA